MADEPAVVRLRLESDPRLIAGVAAGAACCGSAAGLGEAQAAALRAAVRAACEHVFAAAPAAGVLLDLSVSCGSGRLVVTLSRPGTPADAAAPLPALPGVDQVQRETRGDRVFIILTKFIPPSVSPQ